MYAFKSPMLWLTIGWSLVAAVVFLSLAPVPVELDAPGADKYAHVVVYAALTFWFMQIYESGRIRVRVVLGFAALGVMLEFLQGTTGYRSFEYADMAANAAGVVLGWLAAPPRMPNLLLCLEALRARRPVP